MGQKINPLGFRLGATQGHHSLWFAQPKNYSEDLQEDQKIRDCIKNYIKKNMKIFLIFFLNKDIFYFDYGANHLKTSHAAPFAEFFYVDHYFIRFKLILYEIFF